MCEVICNLRKPPTASTHAHYPFSGRFYLMRRCNLQTVVPTDVLPKLIIPAEAQNALNSPETTLLISISGGKDSDAMTYLMLALREIHDWHCQVMLLHCDMGRMEWQSTPAYVDAFAQRVNLPLQVVRYEHRDLLDAIHQRMIDRPDVPPFPSAKARYCTATFKRQVTDKFIRQIAPQRGTIVVAMGLRADESRTRANKAVWSIRTSVDAPTKQRHVYDWLPIHALTLLDVWTTIRANGNVFHEAYSHGNQRLSCALCVLGSLNDLLIGALHNPEIYLELCRIELESGFSFQPNRWLCSLRPELLSESQRQRFTELQNRPKLAKPLTPLSSLPIQLKLF
jgi:3'-phosphoadenosine 5'-phosphosulfate sulfotransferase (PAPS reductase)/FAD synthetase